MGLKYLKKTGLIFEFTLQKSIMISSQICLVFPYGENAFFISEFSDSGCLSESP